MSIKKLQDLLNTGSQSGREPQKLCTQSNKSPSFGHGQFSPMGTVSAVNRSPSYSAIPGVQNMFYHPLVKNQQETVCPSPMFQVPTKKNPQTLNSLFQGSRFTAVETNPTTNHSTLNGNNASSSMNSLLGQLQPQFSSQPRNLEELLQRSFTSMPSGYQSPFTSSMQSPFIVGNNQSSNPQPSMGSDLSKILNPMTLLETSLQSNNFLGSQSNKNSSNEAVNKALILQLADILKQESESKIKSAIAELILKYRALGLLNNLSGTEMVDLQNLINGTEAPQQNPYPFQQLQSQPQPQPQSLFHQEIHPHMPQQNIVPLSNGFAMNAINRNDPAHSMQANMQSYKPNLQQTRIDNARKELFALNEIPMSHQQQQYQQQHQPSDPYQGSLMQGSLFGSHQQMGQFPQKLGVSPINTLNQEMDSLSLNMNTHNFSNFGITSTISAPERIDDLVPEDLGSILKQKVPSDEELPGVYNKQERINKILKYKNKIRKWRREHPVKRVFKGRSVVAGQKPRIKGKFVTLDEYTQHLSHDFKKEYDDSIKEEDF